MRKWSNRAIGQPPSSELGVIDFSVLCGFFLRQLIQERRGRRRDFRTGIAQLEAESSSQRVAMQQSSSSDTRDCLSGLASTAALTKPRGLRAILDSTD